MFFVSTLYIIKRALVDLMSIIHYFFKIHKFLIGQQIIDEMIKKFSDQKKKVSFCPFKFAFLIMSEKKVTSSKSAGNKNGIKNNKKKVLQKNCDYYPSKDSSSSE